MAVGLSHYLVLATVLFLTGMVGVIVRRNALIMLMCVELMLCATNVVFAAFSRHWGSEAGHVFVLMNFAVAAAEAAIGLGLIIALLRLKDNADLAEVNEMRS